MTIYIKVTESDIFLFISVDDPEHGGVAGEMPSVMTLSVWFSYPV